MASVSIHGEKFNTQGKFVHDVELTLNPRGKTLYLFVEDGKRILRISLSADEFYDAVSACLYQVEA